MGKSIEFLAEAREELLVATDWYSARSTQVSSRFLAAVRAAIEAVAADPQRFAFTFAQCRHCRIGGFPYLLVFREDVAEIVVVAVAHTSRRPGHWRDRQ